MNRYSFRTGGKRGGVTAQVIHKELRKKFKGTVTPPQYLKAAASEKSPLHNTLTRDPVEAIRKCHLSEARQILRELVVIDTDQPDAEPMPVFVHVSTDDEGPRYMEIAAVMADPELSSSAVGEALTLLRGIQRRFKHLDELRSVWATLDDVEAPA